MVMINANTLNRKIDLEQKTQAIKASGTPYDTWTSYKSLYAGMFIRTGGMENDNNSSVPQITVEWTIRYNADVDYDMRIKYGGHIYKIIFIEELGIKEGLRIITEVLKFDNEN